MTPLAITSPVLPAHTNAKCWSEYPHSKAPQPHCKYSPRLRAVKKGRGWEAQVRKVRREGRRLEAAGRGKTENQEPDPPAKRGRRGLQVSPGHGIGFRPDFDRRGRRDLQCSTDHIRGQTLSPHPRGCPFRKVFSCQRTRAGGCGLRPQGAKSAKCGKGAKGRTALTTQGVTCRENRPSITNGGERVLGCFGRRKSNRLFSRYGRKALDRQ